MANEVTITVKARADVKPGIEQAKTEAKVGGREIGETLGDGITRGTGGRLRDSRGRFLSMGTELGEALGDGITMGTDGRLRDSRGRFVGMGRGLGDDAGRGFGGTFTRSLSQALSSLSGALKPIGGDIGTAIAAAAAVSFAPAFGAAIAAAVPLALGGGVLAGGIALVANDPAVKSAFGKLKDGLFDKDTRPLEDKVKAANERLAKATALGSESGIKSARFDIEKAKKELEKALSFNRLNTSLRDLAQPFIEPLTRAAQTFTDGVEQLKPAIGELFSTMAPVVDMLAPALVEMFKNMMPGMTSAVKASVPLFQALADYMPIIGDALGDFFQKMADHGPEAEQFFRDFLELIVTLIDFFGSLIIALARVYSFIREVFTGSSEAVSDFTSSASSAFSGFLSRVRSVFNAIISAARSAWNAASSAVTGFVSRAVSSVSSFLSRVRSVFNSVVGAVRGAMNSVLSAITGAWDRAVAAVRRRIGQIQALINSIRGRTVNINVATNAGQAVGRALSQIARIAGNAHGGIIGAASGRIGSGLTWVGEQGPELVNLPTGSTVHSKATSARMMQQMQGQANGGPVQVILQPAPGSEHTLTNALLQSLRLAVNAQGGSVQTVLGRS